MYQLKVNQQQTIVALRLQGWSKRRIARELALDRATVRKYLAQADAKSPTPQTGSAEFPPPKSPTHPQAGSATRFGPVSSCEPWREQIEQALAQGLSIQRIHQDLVTERRFMGSYFAVRRFVLQRVSSQELPFRRMECEPGQELQVDFGKAGWVIQEGKRRRPHLFRAVLSHSRKGYCEAVWRQTSESFIRCLENAFRHFGGVAATVVIDNLKAGVIQADWYDPEINPKLEEFARYYGTVMLPTKPVMPRHKGKVEAGVKYAQSNAVKGRSFESLSAQNLFLSDWEKNVADTRIHGTTRQQVSQLFEQVERAALQPLPAGLFPVFEEALRTVHRDGYVEFKRAYYSAPPEYVGRQVWVRQQSRLLARLQLAPRTDRSPRAGRTGKVRHRSRTSAQPQTPHHRTGCRLSAGSLPLDWTIHGHVGRSDAPEPWAPKPARDARVVAVGRKTSRRRVGESRPCRYPSRHLAPARSQALAGITRQRGAVGLSGNSPVDPFPGRLSH